MLCIYICIFIFTLYCTKFSLPSENAFTTGCLPYRFYFKPVEVFSHLEEGSQVIPAATAKVPISNRDAWCFSWGRKPVVGSLLFFLR